LEAAARIFVEHVRELAGIVYGRRTYEIMGYWDEDHPDWDAAGHDYAAALGRRSAFWPAISLARA
jgi:hypothetical protein